MKRRVKMQWDLPVRSRDEMSEVREREREREREGERNGKTVEDVG